jgi:predicted Zn-dependent protease
MPAEWTGQNLTQAVQGISPNRDAVVQLTLGPGDPASAARQFFAQQGVRAVQSSRQSINGLPAVITAFEVATQEGALQGIVAHIAHGDATYQLLGYSSAARYGAYGNVFEGVIGSFGPVTDPAILNVQPQRIDIVTLPQSMTLGEFARRYASGVPIADLALINQVAGPESTLPAGTLVKRVVS